MAKGYTVTGITKSWDTDATGRQIPVAEVSYVTDTEPQVAGVVSVPWSLVPDKVAYAEAVHKAIMAEVEGHQAVLGLGR